MYINNRIRYEFIVIFHSLIQKQIIDRENYSETLSVKADEIAGIAGIEQVR
jgi:hypothetical protein